ncbi:MAG: hypothetical protein ACREDG_05425, partial [Methylocella sp.]
IASIRNGFVLADWIRNGKKKEIIGIMASDDNAESVSYSLWDHWMHGWREKDILTGVPKLRAAMKGFIDAGII